MNQYADIETFGAANRTGLCRSAASFTEVVIARAAAKCRGGRNQLRRAAVARHRCAREQGELYKWMLVWRRHQALSNIIFPQNFFNETADDAPRPATWCSRAWARGRCCGSLQRTWAWTTIDAKTETCVSWVGEAKAQSWARRTAGRCSRRTSTREQRCDGSRSRTAAEIAGESRSRTSA